MSENRVHIMVAAGIRGEIGTGSGLPWSRLANDMSRFRRITMKTVDASKKNAVVMGRRTWDCLGRKSLVGRINIVLSKNPSAGHDDAAFVSSVKDCRALLEARASEIESVFLIGGNTIIESFMKEAPDCIGSLYITYVMARFPKADTFIDLPKLEAFFPVTFHRTCDYEEEAAMEVHFALRWRLLSDL